MNLVNIIISWDGIDGEYSLDLSKIVEILLTVAF